MHHQCSLSPSSNAGSSVPFRCRRVNILHCTNGNVAREITALRPRAAVPPVKDSVASEFA
jgi:hypothetical protein